MSKTQLSSMSWPKVLVEGSPQDLEVTRFGNLHVLGLLRVDGGILGMGPDYIPSALGSFFYVDGTNGDDNNDGRSWGTAVATIQKALDLARYDASGSLIYTDKERHKFVFVRPGHYNEQVLFSGYNIHLIGLGAVPGKDWGTPSLNYDGAVADTCVLGFSGSGCSFHNFHVYCDGAFPAIYVVNGDNNLFSDIVIEGDGANCTYGMYMNSMKGSWIRSCIIHGFVTAGIAVIGGSNRYFIHGGIEGNQLHSDVAGAKGIYVDSSGNLVAYNARIHQNWIDLVGAGAAAKGIDIDHDGVILTTHNMVQMAASATGIEHAGKGAMFNHVFLDGVLQGAATKSVHDGSLA
jgi:hypothetical protein